ncbi:hypothetical protein PPW95_25340 (plasmid) [Vibrio parahaemolyticus]|uniref:hypothetical protein n=1 Tax=Vibrio harveyi group TaxID=717610 RepID=UPI0009719D96|nr:MULTISPECIES: hypothetical protein [Vibrio harveyi group]APX10062.1 hypothetical protein BWP24_28140 [Vibrio campbellii]WCP78936.1 hypothetical protein PPW95_25340 [Vibrio parahaemolyticus]
MKKYLDPVVVSSVDSAIEFLKSHLESFSVMSRHPTFVRFAYGNDKIRFGDIKLNATSDSEEVSLTIVLIPSCLFTYSVEQVSITRTITPLTALNFSNVDGEELNNIANMLMN